MPDDLPGCFSGLFTRKRQPNTPHQRPASVRDCKSGDPTFGFGAFCDFSFEGADTSTLSLDTLPPYSETTALADVVKTVDNCIARADADLRRLSLQIHSHPEIMFEEKYAHDHLCAYMSSQGFHITKHYLGLDTAWRAEFTHGKGGRVVGINSEMDALKGIGHACGHNLIAISGCGIAIALKAALEAHNIPGSVVLLGTPAEENGAGKSILLDRGGYKNMDICLMCHPAPGPSHTVNIGSCNAMQPIEVEYFGQTAHAAAAPWDGTNALDAAFSAYSSISLLRQQMKPDCRVHGIVEGNNWSPNVIPDYAKMRWYVRAPTSEEVAQLVKRVVNCLEAAALATGCKYELKTGLRYDDLHQNSALSAEFSRISGQYYDVAVNAEDTPASTDFGNVTYALPALHPNFAIPTKPLGGNHTPAFTAAAATKEAHAATLLTIKGLALTGFRVLHDDTYFKLVQDAFTPQSKSINGIS